MAKSEEIAKPVTDTDLAIRTALIRDTLLGQVERMVENGTASTLTFDTDRLRRINAALTGIARADVIAARARERAKAQ